MNQRAPRRSGAICQRQVTMPGAVPSRTKKQRMKSFNRHSSRAVLLCVRNSAQTPLAFLPLCKANQNNLRQERLSVKHHWATTAVRPDVHKKESVVSALSLRIRKARSAAALSQAELARRVGVKRSAVTQWEHPTGTRPSVDHLIEISMHTHTLFEWLATGRGARLAGDVEAAPAVMVEEYARDADESLALGQLRMLSPLKRKIALDILGSMAR